MKARLVKIGNSRGVRLPKALIEQAALSEEVDLGIRNCTIIISRADYPRAGWAEAVAALRATGADGLLAEGDATRFDKTDWKW